MKIVTLMPVMVRLNNKWFADPIDENPKVGTTEIWQWINLTVDAHPMHMHLVQFQVYDRQPFNVAAYTTAWLAWIANPTLNPKPVLTNYFTGLPVPPPPEEMGWKDTVKAYPGMITRVIARFDIPAANPGIPGTATALPADYVYHCHIIEHEDNEMMCPFQVIP